MYYWETERDRAWAWEGQREEETQNLKQAPGSQCSAQSPTLDSNPQTVKSWPELKSDAQPTEPPRRPMMMILLTPHHLWGPCVKHTLVHKPLEPQNDPFCRWGNRGIEINQLSWNDQASQWRSKGLNPVLADTKVHTLHMNARLLSTSWDQGLY